MAKKSAPRFLQPKLITLAVASCFVADAALANPSGATVVHGSASIQQAGNLLQVTNSPSTIINWQSFSIGAAEITRFIQQSAASAVLNRVTTQNPSAILGALQSNGRVFLINPNGIAFGASAQIDVAGLVASTLGLSNEDFLAGRMRFTEMPNAGAITNDGAIRTASGGSVYLVGSDVTNNGVIASPQGEVVLAAGNSVELVNPATPNLRVEVAAADNEARNLGTIVSDAGRIGIYAGLVTQSGTVQADSAVAEGGRIVLKATKSVTLESSSVLSAQGQGGGEILVLADESARVAGRLDASAPNGGDGGFVETSAQKVTVDSGTLVTTTARNGNTGMWLVDPPNFVVAATGGDITGATLGGNLNSTSVTLTSDLGAGGNDGDLFVNDAVAWSSANSLSLYARRHLQVTSSITNSGGGDINLLAGWNGNSITPDVISGTGDLSILSATVSTGGNVLGKAGNDITLSYANLTASGAGTGNRSITLHAVSGAMSVGDSSVLYIGGGDGGNATATLTAAKGIFMGDACGECGGSAISANGGYGSSVNGGDATVTLNGGTGPIDIQDGSSITASAGDSGGGSGNGGKAAVTLSTTGNVTVDNGLLKAYGGYGSTGGAAEITVSGASVTVANSVVEAYGGEGSVGGNATVKISSSAPNSLDVSSSTLRADGGEGSIGRIELASSGGGNITVTNSALYANGGDAYYGNGGTGIIDNNASGALMLTGSTLSAQGGAGYDGNGGAGTIKLRGAGGITADGGEGLAQGGYAYSSGNGGTGTITLDGGSGPILMDNGAWFQAYGGDTGSSSMGNGGDALVSMATPGGITVRGGSTVYAWGGAPDFGASGDGGNGTVVLATGGNLNVMSAQISAMVGGGGRLLGIGEAAPTTGTTALFGGVVNIGGASEVSPTQVSASDSLTLFAISDINVVGGSGDDAFATAGSIGNTNVVAGGGLNVTGGSGSNASALIFGSPDVNATIGTGISLQAGTGSGAGARIAAGSANTIRLVFPLLTTGGFSVNGQPGLIYDSATSTGFLVNGEPAVAGVNFIVIHTGGVPLPVQQAVNQVVQSTNQLPVPGTGDTTGANGEEEKKKSLPICAG